MQDVVKKILGNTFAQILGKAGTAIIALFTVTILSSYFSASTLGDYGTIYEFLAFFGAIADMGIYTLALREMSKHEEKRKEIYAHTISLRFILTIVAMLSAVVVAFVCGLFFHFPAYDGTLVPHGVIFAAVATFFVLMSGTVSVVLQLFWKMRFHSYSLILGKVITFLGILIITKYISPEPTNAAFFWILTMGVLGSAVTFFFTAFFANKEMALGWSFDKKKMSKMFIESLPFGISMILGTLYFRLGYLLLGVLLPRSSDGLCEGHLCSDLESGKYYIATRMMEVLLLLPIFFMNSIIPLLAKSIEEKSPKVPKILESSFLFLLALGLPLGIGGIILGTPISNVLTENKELLTNPILGTIGGDTAFQILCIPLFFSFLSTFFNFSLISFNDQKKVMWANGIALIINTFSNLVLIPDYGLLGAAYSAVISEIVIVILGWVFLSRHSTFLPSFSSVAKVVIASIGMGALALFIVSFPSFTVYPSLSLLLSIGISSLVFLGVLWILRFFTPEMKAILKKSTPENESIAERGV